MENESIGTFLTNLIAKIKTFFTGVVDESEVILTGADKFVSEFETWAKTATGASDIAEVESIVTAIFPEINVASFVSWLGTLFTDLNFVSGLINHSSPATTPQLITGGAAYVAALSGNIKASQLNTLSANVSTYVGSVSGITLPIQQTLSAAQVVHAPATIATVVDTPPVVDVNAAEADKQTS